MMVHFNLLFLQMLQIYSVFSDLRAFLCVLGDFAVQIYKLTTLAGCSAYGPARLSPPRVRHQLRGRGSGLRASEVASVLDRPRRVVLLHVGPVDGVVQALALGAHRAHGDLALGNHNSAKRLLKKRPVPASRLQAPRPHEDAAFHHHGPDADETVRLRSGPDTENLAIADRGQNIFCEALLRFH